MKIYNKDGIEMIEIKSIAREDDRLVVKGKMMGAMATTIYLSPQDVWRAFALMRWSTIASLPVFALKGLGRRGRGASKEKAA